jgi:hypothetical protein
VDRPLPKAAPSSRRTQSRLNSVSL